MYRDSAVAFKGSKNGISIYLNSNEEYGYLKEQLIQKLDSAKLFFMGAKVISFQGKRLTVEEENELKEIIHTQYGMIMLEDHEEELEGDGIGEEVFEGIEEGHSKFIRSTIRSGQRIYFKGNLVIIGDVNPGAEIVADGNILVMGNLRGIAHAGANGNEKAFVAAYSLQATQLRIASLIARAPDNEKTRPTCPEMAIIRDNVVMIEPYLPNK